MANSRVEKIYKTSGINRRVGIRSYTDSDTEPILRTDSFTVPVGMDRARRGPGAAPVVRTTTPIPPIDYSLNAPSNLSASQLSYSSSQVTWDDNSTNEDGFIIERSNDTGSSWSQIADVAANVTSLADTTVTTSSYWYRAYAYNVVTNSLYSATCSLTIVSGSEEPAPPAPEAPIFLMVTSGSAILNWTSGSSDADYYSIHKSLTGASGSYSEITTSAVLTARDHNVTASNTYWYKVAAVNSGGTSSFSNLAAIDILPCSTASFYPITRYGYVGFESASVYRNTYGVSFPFTTSVSQSISVWARSPDFDAYLTLVDSGGNVLVEDDYSGWQLTGESGGYSAAVSYLLGSGSYIIELSSGNDNIGRYYLYISPGPTLEAQWSGSVETSTVNYIPTSNNVVVGENGSKVVFYNKNTQTTTELTWSGGTVQGACYSPTQDKVYVWAYYLTAGQYTASIDELDNTGSYLTSSMFFRAPVSTFPNVDFTGHLSYDRVNDRILFAKYNTQTTQSVVIWDCATRTILTYLNAAPYRNFGFWMSCYSEVNNSYYIAQAYNSTTVPGYPMVKVDADTFAMSNTSVSASIVLSYISASNLMMIRRPGGEVEFYDPVTDAIVHLQSDLPSSGLFEGGGAGDICTNVYVAAIDPGGSPNIPGLALLDRNTYRPQNYLALSYDTASSPNGWFQYSIAFSPNDSKLWSAQSSYDDNIGRLYSIRLSRPIEPPELPTGSFPPYPPNTLAVDSYTTASITLDWVDASSNESGFNLYRQIIPTTSWSLRTTVGPNTTSYIDTTVVSGSYYNYRATSYNAVGESPYSNLVTSASAQESPPSMPTGVTVTGGAPTAADVSMSWSDNSSNELGFYVYRNDGAADTVFTMSANSTNFIDTGSLPPPIFAYTYWVTAFNASGQSAFEGPFLVF